MAIKINNQTVIYDDRTSEFTGLNIGSHTKATLEANQVTGSNPGSFTYCNDIGDNGKIVQWSSPENAWSLGPDIQFSGTNGSPFNTGSHRGIAFTQPGTLVVTGNSKVVNVLVVGGGGGAGYGNGGIGGGGGGGLIYIPQNAGIEVSAGTYEITVGAGGDGNGNDTTGMGKDTTIIDVSGTTLGPLTAKGGGVSAASYGKAGGSSGGTDGDGGTAEAAIQTTQPGRSGQYGYGNIGGTLGGNLTGYRAGGGGGAGESGYPGITEQGKGRGGIGMGFPRAWVPTNYGEGSGSNQYFAGGGGGGTRGDGGGTNYEGGDGGLGGGGDGTRVEGANPGLPTSGGGGGGAAEGNPQGFGGSGIVIFAAEI